MPNSITRTSSPQIILVQLSRSKNFQDGEGNDNPLQCSCLENLRDGGAWWAAVYEVAESWTGQKRLSSNNIYIYACLCTYISMWGMWQTGSRLNIYNQPGSSLASLVAQMVQYLPSEGETWVWSMDWEDPLEIVAWQPTPVFLPGESPWTEGPGGHSSWDHKVSNTAEPLSIASIGSSLHLLRLEIGGLQGLNSLSTSLLPEAFTPRSILAQVCMGSPGEGPRLDQVW